MKSHRLMLGLLTLLAPVLIAVERLTEAIVGTALRGFDACIFTLTRTFDMLMPMRPELIAASGADHASVRELRHLTTGLHMRAQPSSHLGNPKDPEDDDGGDDHMDNGLRHSPHH